MSGGLPPGSREVLERLRSQARGSCSLRSDGTRWQDVDATEILDCDERTYCRLPDHFRALRDAGLFEPVGIAAGRVCLTRREAGR